MIKRNVFAMLKTLLFMWGLTAIFLLVMAVVVYKLHGEETGISVCVYITYILVNFAGGFIFGKVMDKKKYIFGMITGALYFLTLLIISAIITGSLDVSGMKAGLTLLCCVLSGMSGGMLSN